MKAIWFTLALGLWSLSCAAQASSPLFVELVRPMQEADRIQFVELEIPSRQGRLAYLVRSQQGLWLVSQRAPGEELKVERLDEPALKRELDIRRSYLPVYETSRENFEHFFDLPEIESVELEERVLEGAGDFREAALLISRELSILQNRFVDEHDRLEAQGFQLHWKSNRTNRLGFFIGFAPDVGAVMLSAYPAALFTIANFPSYGPAIGHAIWVGGALVLGDHIRDNFPHALDLQRGAGFHFLQPGEFGFLRRVRNSFLIMSASIGCAAAMKALGII